MKDRSGFFESDLGRGPRAERIFVVGTMTGAMFVLLLWAAISVMTEPSAGSWTSNRLPEAASRQVPSM